MATTTARPSRTRAAKSTPAAAKAAPAKTAEKPTEDVKAESPADGHTGRIVVELTHVGDTKSFAKFQFPEGSRAAGNVYLPLGTTRAGVVFYTD